ncbi:MAG: TFIIB-type zinc ribbon-containing protein [Planctomycetota bacterium]
MALCPRCGNEVDDPATCGVCRAGRAAPKSAPQDQGQCVCPRCSDPLQQQDWEGVATLNCPSCRGTLFPDRGLEAVLNKLRATCDPVDVATVHKEFRGRFKRELPEAVRYKSCPVCGTVMTRQNYGTVSGVIVDCCPDHGVWVDEAAFAALADFICRGGDLLASDAAKVRARLAPKQQKGRDQSLLERFFGSGS